MPARVIRVNPTEPEAEAIAEAARAIRRGELVVFPTETVYGLGADGTNPAAVARIFQAKGRPPDNPLILHVAAPEDVGPWVGITLSPSARELRGKANDFSAPAGRLAIGGNNAAGLGELARRLMDLFWPGPLTLILPRSSRVPDLVTAGLDTVAVRMPAHPVALALLRAAQVPIAAPSANLSGRPSPTTAAHVLADLGSAVALILDGGSTAVGLESTVLDLTVHPPVILRPGAVTREELEAVLGPVRQWPELAGRTGRRDGDLPAGEREPGPLSLEGGEAGPARSPGLKYRHYAPLAPLYLVQDPAKLLELARQKKARGKFVGILASEENAGLYAGEGFLVLVTGSRQRLSEVAARLYTLLRAFDEAGVDLILAETYPATGVGAAIMNRLWRAAEGRILE